MSNPNFLYGWSDQNASPTAYYTDNTTLTRGMTLYNNQGVDTGERVGYIHDGMFEIEDYFSLYNENTSDQGGTVYTGSFTPKRNGYYKVTLVGAGGTDYYDKDKVFGDIYDYTAAGGGSGAGIIVEVYLEKTRTYSIQCGAGHYQANGDSTYISYSDGTNTYTMSAGGGQGSSYSSFNGATGYRAPGSYSISSGWNIRNTILSTNGSYGTVAYTEDTASEHVGAPYPPLAGGASVISGTSYGAGADYTIRGFSGHAGNGGYIEIQLIYS